MGFLGGKHKHTEYSALAASMSLPAACNGGSPCNDGNSRAEQSRAEHSRADEDDDTDDEDDPDADEKHMLVGGRR